MPKVGFKTITLPESVYDNFHIIYENQKEEIKMQGVFSFAAFIAFKLNLVLKREEK